MTVLPGSLDYLYYGGIIDHIPYEAYDIGMSPVQMHRMPPLCGYGCYAQNTYMAPNYTAAYENQYDTFTKSGTSNKKEEKSYRESLLAGFEKTKNTVNSTPSVIKGLIGGAVMLGTLFLLIKGKKKP